MVVKIIVLSGYGINSEAESAHAFSLAGGKSEIVHINDLIKGIKRLSEYDILFFPGGFSYGDDTGSGNAYANKFKNHLWNDLIDFIKAKKLILGICNGFQVMVNMGLFQIENEKIGQRNCALIDNTSARFECRDVFIKVNQKSNCVFTKGIDITHLVVSHGEGRFFCEEEFMEKLISNNQVVFNYCDEKGASAFLKYPLNPNGSIKDVAGICDPTGRIFGMMPHPERAIYSTSEADYHLKYEQNKRQGLKIPEYIESNLMIFKNAVNYIDKLN
jgi:phosphoribosylformylglycinamidine synthase subunit PurQ / glutaminase